MKFNNYLIYRHGSNSSNQPMAQLAPVAIVTAKDRFEAKAKAAGLKNAECYNNQHLSAVPRSRAKAADWNAVCDDDAEATANGCESFVI